MIADIDFYLEGTVESRLAVLIAPESPLRLDKEFETFFTFRTKNPLLDHFFTYGKTDRVVMTSQRTYGELEQALGFSAGIDLSYGGCYLNPAKVQMFRGIAEYLGNNRIPYFMTVMEESGEVTLIAGHNPLTDTRVSNPHFSKELLDIFEHKD